MSDTTTRRRLATALAAAVLAAPPVLAGCAVPDATHERSALATTPSADGRPRHPSELKFESPAYELRKSQRVVLSNGMVVHLMEDHALPLVDASATFRGGSVFDPPGKEGLASLACGLVRAGGTKSSPADKLDEELDTLAGSVGVGGGNESLFASFSFLSKDLDRGLAIFADVLRNPAFDDGRFQASKAQALQGLRRQFQNPGSVLQRTFATTAYGGHPYGRLVTQESLQSITADDIKAFHAKWFHPESFILSVAGDFKTDDLVAKLEKAFAGWEKSAEPLPQWPEPFARAYPGGHIVVAMPGIDQTNVRMGHWAPPENSVDRVHLEVLNDILGGGGFWSRMTKVVRTKEGLAYSVGSGLSRNSQGGLFLAATQTKASTTYRAASLMKKLIEEIRETPVTQEDLELAKESRLNSFVQVLESPAALCAQYASLEFRGFPADWLEKYLGIVRSMTVEDATRVTKEYLKPESLLLVVVGDPKAFDAAPEHFGPAQQAAPK